MIAFSAFFSPAVLYSPLLNAELQFGDWRASAAGCYLTGWRDLARPVTVEYVYDGDTARLADGRKVRLLGINTPELERDGRRVQPYAEVARRSALNHLASGEEWYLLVGRERRDRYGRWLGYLLNREGVALGSMLIAEGSAFWVAQGEDISHVSCFQEQESIARAERRGVWSSTYWQPLRAGELDRGTLGFRLVAGQVTKVEKTKSATYVELDDHLVLRISGRINAPVGGWPALMGRDLEVRGWVIWRKLTGKQTQKGFRSYMINLSSGHQFKVVH